MVDRWFEYLPWIDSSISSMFALAAVCMGAPWLSTQDRLDEAEAKVTLLERELRVLRAGFEAQLAKVRQQAADETKVLKDDIKNTYVDVGKRKAP